MFVLAMGVSAKAEECVKFEKISENRYISKQSVEPQKPYGVTFDGGTVVIPFEYYDIKGYKDKKLYAVKKEKDGLYGIIDESNKVIIDFKYEYAFYKYDGELFGIVNHNGRRLCYKIANGREYLYYSDAVYKIEDANSDDENSGTSNFIENYMWRSIAVGEKLLISRKGITDNSGNVIVPFEFKDIKEIDKGELYAVGKKNAENSNCNYGLFDTKSGLITYYKYYEVFDENGEWYGKHNTGDGIEYYKLKNGRETLVNTTEYYRDLTCYDDFDNMTTICSPLSKGRTRASHSDEMYPRGIIDRLGRIVIPFEYYDIDEINGGNQYVVNKVKNGLYGVIDENNNMLADYKYTKVLGCDGIVYGMLPGKDGKNDYYKIDSSGEHYYKSFEGDIFGCDDSCMLYCVKNKLTAANVKNKLTAANISSDINKKYGLVDKELNVILEPLYDNVIVFNEEGYATVHKGSTYTYYDYDESYYSNKHIEYTGGKFVYLKKEGNKITEVDKKNNPIAYGPGEKVVIEPIYTPEVRRLLALLKTIEVMAIVTAIGCIRWLVNHIRKKHD